jgi:hypothetical protein
MRFRDQMMRLALAMSVLWSMSCAPTPPVASPATISDPPATASDGTASGDDDDDNDNDSADSDDSDDSTTASDPDEGAGTGWYCFTGKGADGDGLTSCERTEETCQSTMQDDMMSPEPGETWSACVAQETAYCYSYDLQENGGHIEACYGESKDCDELHDLSERTSTGSSKYFAAAGSVTPCTPTP